MHVVSFISGFLQSGPLLVIRCYKYGCNSTYRGCNPNYPLISEFTGAITPFASSNWDGPFAGPHYGKSCHVACTFTVTNDESCLLAKWLISWWIDWFIDRLINWIDGQIGWSELDANFQMHWNFCTNLACWIIQIPVLFPHLRQNQRRVTTRRVTTQEKSFWRRCNNSVKPCQLHI